MKLSGSFGPIPIQTTLDGSGNGTVTFQPTGDNARITTLFVKVSTAVLQANVNIYKGQVADSNIVGNTPSGSTGAPAFGNIDLFDGETLYVVWSGGDAGAIATATFVGQTIPFDQVGGSSIRWSDPIAGNDGSLVFPAIKSPNYVTNVAGWFLDRDGNAEFNNVTVRGTLDVEDPSDGTYVRIYDENPGDGAVIDITTSRIRHGTSPNTGFLGLLIEGPPVGTRRPGIEFGQNNFGASDTSIFGDNISLFFPNDGVLSLNGIDPGRGLVALNGSGSSSAAVNNIETAVLTISPFATVWKAGRTYKFHVSMNISVSATIRPLFRIRKTNVGGTQLAISGTQPANTGLYVADFSGYFYVTGSDVAANLVLTIIGTAAQTVQALAVYAVSVHDVGDESRSNTWAAQLS